MSTLERYQRIASLYDVPGLPFEHRRYRVPQDRSGLRLIESRFVVHDPLRLISADTAEADA